MTDPVDPSWNLVPQPDGLRHRFHAMVKPTGSQCNLDCTYCFYLHKDDLLKQPKVPRMSDAMLEAHIRQYIEAQTGDEVVFSWQGGEPTLMGLDFFRRVVELERRYQKDPRSDTPYLLPPKGTTDQASLVTEAGTGAIREIKEWQAIMDHLRRLPAAKPGDLPIIPVDGRAAEIRAIKVG